MLAPVMAWAGIDLALGGSGCGWATAIGIWFALLALVAQLQGLLPLARLALAVQGNPETPAAHRCPARSRFLVRPGHRPDPRPVDLSA